MSNVVDLNRYKAKLETGFGSYQDGFDAQEDTYDPLSPEYSALPNYSLMQAQFLDFLSMVTLEWSHQLMCRAEALVKNEPVFIDFTEEWDEPEFDEPA